MSEEKKQILIQQRKREYMRKYWKENKKYREDSKRRVKAWKEANKNHYHSLIKSWSKKYYKEHTEKWHKTRTYSRNHLILIQKLGEKSSRCHFSDIRALQLNHLKGEGHKD